MPLRELKAQCEKEYIEYVLRRTQWNVQPRRANARLQRTYLHETMTALGINRSREGRRAATLTEVIWRRSFRYPNPTLTRRTVPRANRQEQWGDSNACQCRAAQSVWVARSRCANAMG